MSKSKRKVTENESENAKIDFSLNEKCLMLYKNRLYVPNVLEIKSLILNEVHKSPYSGHPGYQKMITMLRKYYFHPNMKNEVAEYIARCIECEEVKDEHRHPTGLLQPLPIPYWKWEIISLDFRTGFPKNQYENDYVMVAVDKLSKEAHFIHVKTTYKDANIVASILMKEIFQLHGIPKVIIFYKDPKFTGNF